MPVSVVVQITAKRAGSLLNGTGIYLHGALFQYLGKHHSAYGDELHLAQVKPYTLSPLFGLPRVGGNGDLAGLVHFFPAGQPAWFRATSLVDHFSAVLADWLTELGNRQELQIGDTPWQIQRIYVEPSQHPLAQSITYTSLQEDPYHGDQPYRIQLRFTSPTTFSGSHFDHPLPLPETLVQGWLRGWNAFSGSQLPEELVELARTRMVIAEYHLRTSPTRTHSGKDTIGFTGEIAFSGHRWDETLRRQLRTLAAYAFYCGSGAGTALGFGQTLPVDSGSREDKDWPF